MRNADIVAMEKELSDLLGMKVALNHAADGSGELRIAYRNLDQFDALVRKLKRQ
jgi:ParB family chromosome partitioning protein